MPLISLRYTGAIYVMVDTFENEVVDVSAFSSNFAIDTDDTGYNSDDHRDATPEELAVATLIAERAPSWPDWSVGD